MSFSLINVEDQWKRGKHYLFMVTLILFYCRTVNLAKAALITKGRKKTEKRFKS